MWMGNLKYRGKLVVFDPSPAESLMKTISSIDFRLRSDSKASYPRNADEVRLFSCDVTPQIAKILNIQNGVELGIRVGGVMIKVGKITCKSLGSATHWATCNVSLFGHSLDVDSIDVVTEKLNKLLASGPIDNHWYVNIPKVSDIGDVLRKTVRRQYSSDESSDDSDSDEDVRQSRHKSFEKTVHRQYSSDKSSDDSEPDEHVHQSKRKYEWHILQPFCEEKNPSNKSTSKLQDALCELCDPDNIIQKFHLPGHVTCSTPKSCFRSLSKKYHPDKTTTQREAAERLQVHINILKESSDTSQQFNSPCDEKKLHCKRE